MLTIALAALTTLLHMQTPAPPRAGAVVVAVRYQPASDPARRRFDLETMQQLRFNAIVTGTDSAAGTTTVSWIDGLLRGDGVPFTTATRELGVVKVSADAHVNEVAWWQYAKGVRGIVFDDWNGLRRHDAALSDAAAFADSIVRNQDLYAPLRRVDKSGARAVTIEVPQGGPGGVEAEWLESAETLLLIAVNHTDGVRDVRLLFSPEMPAAIWQNMLSGGAVNFVAGPKGPVYSRTFAPHDVLVLMIRKRWR
jgi:hypothetical protein